MSAKCNCFIVHVYCTVIDCESRPNNCTMDNSDDDTIPDDVPRSPESTMSQDEVEEAALEEDEPVAPAIYPDQREGEIYRKKDGPDK